MSLRDFQTPGRSPVYCANAMCATSHPLASQAALTVLRRGGNAVDAAVTAAAVLAVVEPQMTGIGGDCFAIVARPGKPLAGVNGSGRAPGAASLERYRELGMSAIPVESPHAVTVPGALDAWDTLLREFGTIGLDEALQPAIGFASEGFFVAPRVAFDWRDAVPALAADKGSHGIYLRDGRALLAGEKLALPALAQTLKAVAKGGRDAFYCGPVAENMVRHLNALGGLHTLEDFAATRSDLVTPVLNAYRGYDLAELPPNGQGITAQLMLNILEHFDLGGLDPDGVTRVHLEAEATRSAYRFRDQFIADPAHMQIGVAQILDKALGARLAARIAPDRRAGDLGPVSPSAGSDTVYLTIVDKDWNTVSFINSIYHAFGSRITDPQTGVLFQSRGTGFSLDPAHVNCIAGGKRPFHTIIPGMLLKDGRATASFGVMGGAFQPVGHVHLATNLIDFGMDVQAAIDHPRSFYDGTALICERGIAPEICGGLTALGHDVRMAQKPWGGAQAIMLDWDKGLLTGGSDPRKDGCAIGY